MNADIIVIAIVLLLVGASAIYILRQRKKGIKCIGCPDSKTCGSCQGGCSGCTGCQNGSHTPE